METQRFNKELMSTIEACVGPYRPTIERYGIGFEDVVQDVALSLFELNERRQIMPIKKTVHFYMLNKIGVKGDKYLKLRTNSKAAPAGSGFDTMEEFVLNNVVYVEDRDWSVTPTEVKYQRSDLDINDPRWEAFCKTLPRSKKYLPYVTSDLNYETLGKKLGVTGSSVSSSMQNIRNKWEAHINGVTKKLTRDNKWTCPKDPWATPEFAAIQDEKDLVILGLLNKGLRTEPIAQAISKSIGWVNGRRKAMWLKWKDSKEAK